MREMKESSDMGVALGMTWHIEHPCHPRLRKTYLDFARQIIRHFKDDYAVGFLEGIIQDYSGVAD